MTVTTPKVSAAVGEITPYAWFRTDLQWYTAACRVMRNFMPLPWGPLAFRPGFRFVLGAKNTNKDARLVPFRFGYTDGQAYILEMGDLYFRVFADKGRVGTVDVVTVYAESDLLNLRWAQSADALYVVDSRNAPQKITRSAHTSWAIASAAFKDGPYYPQNLSETKTLALSGTSGSVTVTATGHTPFASTDVGRAIRLWDETAGGQKNWFWVKITAYTDSSHVTGTIYKAGSTDAYTTSGSVSTYKWRLGLYSDTTGWPWSICAHQGRLAIAGAPSGSLPRIDLSKSGDLENFQPTTEDYANKLSTTADDDSVGLAVASGDINVIFGLHSLRDLIALAAGKEFAAAAGVAGEVMTPTTSAVRPVTAHGSARTHAAEAFNAILFVQRDGRTVRELSFAIDADGYRARSLMWRAEHMLRRGAKADGNSVRELAFQQEPFSALWTCDALGHLASLVYAPEQDLFGWAPHDVAGSTAGAAMVRSLAVIPYAGTDQLWAIVKRTVNGATLYSIEFLEERLDWDDRIENAFHLDCGLSLDNTVAQTLTPGTGADTKGTTGVSFTAGGSAFAAGDVGRFILYHHKATPGDYRKPESTSDARLRGKVILPGGVDLDTGFVLWLSALAEITGYTSATVVTATIREAFPSTAAIAASAWHLTVTTISGLSHLEGETVAVIGDGAPQTDKTVSSGAITLDNPAATVHAGLKYQAYAIPLLADDGSRQGTSVGKPQRQHKVDIALLKSAGGKVFALDSAATEQIPYRRAADLMDLRLQPFTGVKPIPLGGGTLRDPKLVIQQDLPLPLCVAAIVPHRNVGEGG